jgi:pyruvate dehydrogenase complex dehydrogenase (E1) component
MSEKPRTMFDSNEDASVEELQALVDQGLADNAVRIATIKLEQLETVVADVQKIVQGDEGEISKENWQVAKVDILRQIDELKDFIEQNNK